MSRLTDIAVYDTLITGPTLEPLDLDEVKKHLRFSPTSEDTLLDTWISAARQYFEEQTGRQLLTATWERRLDAFPVGLIELPHPPLQDVVSVTYLDDNGDTQTLDDDAYVVTTPAGPQATRGFLEPAMGTSWPSAGTTRGTVRVRYTAGYGDHPGDVPELVKGVLGLLVGHFHRWRAEVHETRQGTQISRLPFGVPELIAGFKYTALPVYPPMQWTVTAL